MTSISTNYSLENSKEKFNASFAALGLISLTVGKYWHSSIKTLKSRRLFPLLKLLPNFFFFTSFWQCLFASHYSKFDLFPLLARSRDTLLAETRSKKGRRSTLIKGRAFLPCLSLFPFYFLNYMYFEGKR